MDPQRSALVSDTTLASPSHFVSRPRRCLLMSVAIGRPAQNPLVRAHLCIQVCHGRLKASGTLCCSMAFGKFSDLQFEKILVHVLNLEVWLDCSATQPLCFLV